MTRKRKIVLGCVAAVILGVGVWAAFVWKSDGPVLKEVAKDLKAGAMSRHAAKPFERFMEIRYGSMNEPANRQKAFLSFFDPAHLEGMHRLVGYMREGERQTNIAASAEWIARYRDTMSQQEREALSAWVNSDEGRATLQRASAIYRSRDVQYRAATEPVIREMMATLATLRK